MVGLFGELEVGSELTDMSFRYVACVMHEQIPPMVSACQSNCLPEAVALQRIGDCCRRYFEQMNGVCCGAFVAVGVKNQSERRGRVV